MPHVALFDTLPGLFSIGFAGLLVIGGILLLLGLFTRTTTFLLSGETAVAYLMAPACWR